MPQPVRGLVIGLSVLTIAAMAHAQESVVAFVDVYLIPMDRERIESSQTVIVRGDRIAAVGPSSDIVVPDGATVVDGSGRYLLPGLMDAHVHLEGGPFWQGSREDFGDGALYLASGVTSVLNLRGTPRFLEWRRRVAAGELLGPTIYTTGEFVIGPGGPAIAGPSGELLVGPNAETAADIERVVAAQAHQGVDAIKYYGGLSETSYEKLTEAARAAGLPLVGHSPDHLGLEVWLRGGQSVAHMHQLSNLYFFPPGALFANIRILLLTALGLAGLVTIAVIVAIAAVIGRWRKHLPARVPTGTLPIAAMGAAAATAFAVLLVDLGIDGVSLGAIFTTLAVVVMAMTGALLFQSCARWRNLSGFLRARLSVAALAGVTLTYALATFWIPIAWRGTDANIEHVARRINDAGIPVQTTLIVWAEDAARSAITDPAFEHLPPSIRDRWRSMTVGSGASRSFLEFQMKLTRTLHRAGVELVAGTDALGAPFIVPGLSLQQELALLTESGLAPYEAIRTATVNPAAFLGRDGDFGTIAVGKRADLLLLDENPLEDLKHLRALQGVMVRGRWVPHERLQRLLASLS